MEIIGYDNNWALVCSNCNAIIKYNSDDIQQIEIQDRYNDSTTHIIGIKCPICGALISERAHRKRIICKDNLNETSYYFAAADDKVIIV